MVLLEPMKERRGQKLGGTFAAGGGIYVGVGEEVVETAAGRVVDISEAGWLGGKTPGDGEMPDTSFLTITTTLKVKFVEKEV